MGKEIERKFKVRNSTYKDSAECILYRQGYLNSMPGRVVRVRVVADKGYITIKGPSNGSVRTEFEYEIPYKDASYMIGNLCEKPVIEKYRYRINHEGMLWEVDEFLGVNEGLAIAEVELEDEYQEFTIPEWAGEEVTDDPRYYNSNLVNRPFNTW